MILTGAEIKKEHECKKILIHPFSEDQLNPNSYNYRLGHDLIMLDPSSNNGKDSIARKHIRIPEEGFVLEPKKLYLGSTFETIGSSDYAISLIGRSSVGRLGLHLQLAANLGHTGTGHCWTLEIRCVMPIRLYAEMIIGQVSFWSNQGFYAPYQGIYKNFSNPQEAFLTKVYRSKVN